ncbi:MAG TPA: hypothetical protein VMX74_07000 [Pirellulales bacterium]|nr:hypothetical protein [Pirellulales bacterium]
MAFVPDTQQGASIAFTALSIDIAAEQIPETTQAIPTIDVVNLASVTQRPYIVGDLNDVAEFTVVFQNDGSSTKPTLGTTYTTTITAPLMAGDATAEYWAGSCIVTGISSPAFSAGANDIQRVSVTVKPSGVGAGGGTLWARTPAA